MKITESFGTYSIDGINGFYKTTNNRTWVQIHFYPASGGRLWVGNASIGTYEPPRSNNQCRQQIVEQIKKHAEKLHESTL